MRRFIILSVVGLSLSVGSSTMAQAAVYKQVSTKVVVEKTVVTEHVVPARVEHWTIQRWNHDFHRFHR